MGGRGCVPITLLGAALQTVVNHGEWQAVKMLQDTHIFRSPGFALLERLHFDELERPVPDEVVRRDQARVRACARRLFTAGTG